MADFETEEQQVEALKRWWSENGRAVMLGIGLGLAMIFGFRGWQGHKESAAQDASGEYTDIMQSLERSDEGEQFLGLVKNIREQHGDSPYAALASLAEARFQVEQDQLPEAETALRWAIDNGSFREIVPVAKLRLARVLKAQDKHQDALDVLDTVSSTSYAGHVEEIRGDIYLDLGETSQAATAYQRARESGTATNSGAALQLKIDDLAVDVTDDKS